MLLSQESLGQGLPQRDQMSDTEAVVLGKKCFHDDQLSRTTGKKEAHSGIYWFVRQKAQFLQQINGKEK